MAEGDREMSTACPAAGTAKTPGQLFGLVFGAVYVLVGILGFIDPLVDDENRLLGLFGILIEDGQALDLNNNAADTVLHFGTAALALYFGTAGSGVGRTTSTA